MFDISNVLTPFVVESVGGNLQVEVSSVYFTRPLVLLGDSVGEGFNALLYHGYGEDGDADSITVTGGVINGTHVNGGNISIGSTTGALDLSAFETGVMSFDLRVVNAGNSTDILIKMDTGTWPHVGDVALSETTIGMPADDQWYSYEINVADFIANDNRLDGSGVFDITNVLTPFVVESVGGNLQVEVRNIKLAQ